MPIGLVPNHLHCSVNKNGIVWFVTMDAFNWDDLAPKLGMFAVNTPKELGLSREDVSNPEVFFSGPSAVMLLQRLFDLEDTDEVVSWTEIERLCESNGLNAHMCHSDERSITYCIMHPDR